VHCGGGTTDELRSADLLEAIPDAMLGVDSGGRIVLVNVQAERLFGYQRADLVGSPVDMLTPDWARGMHVELRERYFADPAPRTMGAGAQLAGRRGDGTEFPAEISLSALETVDGRIVLAAVRDVSDRIAALAERQRLLTAAEEARHQARVQRSERLESLGQLAGGVAHDFNNLIGVIQNYAGFVSEQVQAAAAEPGGARWRAACEDIGQVERAAGRAAELTRQLLAYGRRDVARPRVVDLNAVVGEVERVLRRTLGQQVRLDIALAPDLWRSTADPDQLEQVLVNLAVNARDAMPGGGTLTITTANLGPAAGPPPPWLDRALERCVQLRVADTGHGMSADTARRAFEPFFTTKAAGAGTGLGLATVRGIVVGTGGDIHLDSTPGQGTTVTIVLPVTDDEDAARKVLDA
jgi:PAS domain S-box-containing protein